MGSANAPRSAEATTSSPTAAKEPAAPTAPVAPLPVPPAVPAAPAVDREQEGLGKTTDGERRGWNNKRSNP